MDDQEIIRTVAEKVMGWIIKIRDYPRPGHCWIYDKDGNEVMALFKFNPLTNANHWMMVVEKMRELGWCGSISWWGKNQSSPIWCAKFYHFEPDRSTEDFFHDNLGHAICLAALAALEDK